MREFKDLTTQEKERIQMYLTLRLMSNIKSFTLIIVSMMLYVPGIILIFANVLSLLFLGVILIFMAVSCILFIIQMKEKDDKYLKLSLGINCLMEDIFEIKKSDVNSLKKVWKVIK